MARGPQVPLPSRLFPCVVSLLALDQSDPCPFKGPESEWRMSLTQVEGVVLGWPGARAAAGGGGGCLCARRGQKPQNPFEIPSRRRV